MWPPGMERQVGLVRGTRWTTGSSAVHMVQEEQDDVVYKEEPVRGASLIGVCWFGHKTNTEPVQGSG